MDVCKRWSIDSAVDGIFRTKNFYRFIEFEIFLTDGRKGKVVADCRFSPAQIIGGELRFNQSYKLINFPDGIVPDEVAIEFHRKEVNDIIELSKIISELIEKCK